MKKNIFSQSKDMSSEYCISIVEIGEVRPVENSDFLGVVLVNGREIIVRKDIVKEGDIMLYASNECQLNEDFLSINNMFEDIAHNANYDEVNKWLEQNVDQSEDDRKAYLQAHRGYFDKRCRVRMKKLRGVLSMGFLFGVNEITNWCPMLKDMTNDDWKSLVGMDFDTVNGELFVKAYVPPVPENHHGGGSAGKRNKLLARFDRMIPGQFSFHYSTAQLNKDIVGFKPDDIVDISVKRHGHSLIIGNILVKKPRWKGLYEKIFCYLPKFLQFTYEDYDIVESSRTVIINKDINPNKPDGYYGGNVQRNISLWADWIGKYIPKGMTIYGEVCGYYEGSNSPIQTVGGMIYDYKSSPGENSLMIYRISMLNEDGTRSEWDVQDVYYWTMSLIQTMESNGDKNYERIQPIDLLYHGKLRDLYPDLDVKNHWHENLLERMKNDKERFGMEGNEPLCRNKCFREGIVVRRVGDVVPSAWKLKCLNFLGKEASDMDKGLVCDEEMMLGY